MQRRRDSPFGRSLGGGGRPLTRGPNGGERWCVPLSRRFRGMTPFFIEGEDITTKENNGFIYHSILNQDILYSTL